MREPSIRLALFIGISLAVLQQITGINTVIYYGPQIFQMAGFTSDSASILAQTLVGAVNCGMTLVAIFFVDRIGRKPLLYIGLTGMFVALAALATAFAQVKAHRIARDDRAWSMMVYVGCFAFSLGPIVWLLISEIFPLRVRGMGMSLSTLANWVGNFARVAVLPDDDRQARALGDVLDLCLALHRDDLLRASDGAGDQARAVGDEYAWALSDAMRPGA